MVLVKLLFFARARELAGVSERAFDISEGFYASDELRDRISQFEPSLKPILDSCIVTVDLEYVVESVEITDRTLELAVVPPVSGG